VKGKPKQVLIEKNLDALSAADIKAHWPLVQAAIQAEIGSFHQHHVFERVPRKGRINIYSSRCVLRFRLIDGRKAIKARLTIRGFEDTADVPS